MACAERQAQFRVRLRCRHVWVRPPFVTATSPSVRCEPRLGLLFSSSPAVRPLVWSSVAIDSTSILRDSLIWRR